MLAKFCVYNVNLYLSVKVHIMNINIKLSHSYRYSNNTDELVNIHGWNVQAFPLDSDRLNFMNIAGCTHIHAAVLIIH